MPFIVFRCDDNFSMKSIGTIRNFLLNCNREGSIVPVHHNLQRIISNNYMSHISFRFFEWNDYFGSILHHQRFFMGHALHTPKKERNYLSPNNLKNFSLISLCSTLEIFDAFKNGQNCTQMIFSTENC